MLEECSRVVLNLTCIRLLSRRLVEALLGAALARDSYTFPLNAPPVGCSPCQMEVSLAEAFGGGVAYHFTHELDSTGI
jgi:hypothetical protein